MIKAFAKVTDPRSLAAEMRMHRQSHKGAFLLLEGASDIRRFRKFVSAANCIMINCFGKPNVVMTSRMMFEDGYEDCLGLIDADFDRLTKTLPVHEALIPSATHDFDLDAVTSSLFERYIDEVGDVRKVASFGGSRGLFTSVLQGLKPLSALRFANVKEGLGFKLSDLKLENFFDGKSVDIPKMVDEVFWGASGAASAKSTLRSRIDQYINTEFDLLQATSGHDFCAALGIALRDVAGDRKHSQTWRSEVEMHVRISIDIQCLGETGLLEKISEWEKLRSCYRILEL